MRLRYRCLLVDKGADEARALPDVAGKAALAKLLEGAILGNNAASCAAAAGLIESGVVDRRMQNLALGWLRKLAHRGYEDEFRSLMRRLGAAAALDPKNLSRLAAGLDEMEALFSSRLTDSRRYARIDGRRPTQ